MQNLLSEYRTIKNIGMGVSNKGCCVLKYPHSIDDGLLALYAQGLTIPEISKKVGIPYETVRRRLIENGAKPSSPRFVVKFGDIRYIGHHKYWSEEEEQRFKEYFPFHTNEEVSEEFCCKLRQVRNKARQLGLSKDNEWLHSKNIHSLKLLTLCLNQVIKGCYSRKVTTIAVDSKKAILSDIGLRKGLSTIKSFGRNTEGVK